MTTPAHQQDALPRRVRLVAAGRASDDGLAESYRRLADVFHDVLPEQSPDAAGAHRRRSKWAKQ